MFPPLISPLPCPTSAPRKILTLQRIQRTLLLSNRSEANQHSLQILTFFRNMTYPELCGKYEAFFFFNINSHLKQSIINFVICAHSPSVWISLVK